MTLFVCTGNKGKIEEYQEALENRERLVGLKEVEGAVGRLFPEPEEDYDIFLGNAFLKLFSSIEFLASGNSPLAPCEVSNVLVDDSGLCVPALGLEPGVHSAYYGGLPRDAAKNRVALGKAIDQKSPTARLDAFFVCFLLTTGVSPLLLEWVRSQRNLSRGFPLSLAERLEKEFMQKAKDAVATPGQAGGWHSREIPLSDLFPGAPSQAVAIHFGFCVGEVSSVEQNLIPGAGHGYDSMFYARQHPALSFASISLEQKNRESHRALAMNALCGAPSC